MDIRFQADDFFNAYQVLRTDGENKFKRRKPSGGVGGFEDGLPVMCAGVVCLAFSVELYIKDLHFAVTGKTPYGHDILKLYEGLPEEVRQKVFSHETISQNPFATSGNIFSPKRFTSAYSAYDGFIDQIKAISDGFEKWRYSYERTTLKYEEWFALVFIEAVKSVADTIRTRSAA